MYVSQIIFIILARDLTIFAAFGSALLLKLFDLISDDQVLVLVQDRLDFSVVLLQIVYLQGKHARFLFYVQVVEFLA